MDTIKQQALDYTLGVLPKEESILFEALLEQDEEAHKSLVEAQEDCARLSLTAPPSKLSEEVRSRIIEQTHPPLNMEPFLGTIEMECLRENFSAFENRYSGGGGAVDLSDISLSALKDEVAVSYENLLKIMPLVSGNSEAAAGDFYHLQKELRSFNSFSEGIDKTLGFNLNDEDPATRSVLRSALATMPSLSFFSDRLRQQDPSIGDTRRLFYLCRDQLKIMRASFRDLDPQRLIEDEKLRLHGAGLLQSKWWGSEHAYFSSTGKVRCGHFFEGPVTERCVEFAEYDANMYCLANLLASRSQDGEFHMELMKDAVPGCTLAVATARMDKYKHASLESIINGNKQAQRGLVHDQYLWTLIEDSMIRGHKCDRLSDLRAQQAYGCRRLNGYTYLWFAWPAIPNAQDGADAST